MHQKEYNYTDPKGKKVKIPAECAVSQVEGENIMEDGLVIIDINGNEWVWIEVPKSIYLTAKSNTDYANIELDMQNYVKDYKVDGVEDIWRSEVQHGFVTSTDYENYKNNMLKSVYDNEGFFIARYEVGTLTARTSGEDELSTPMIKQGAYPYNYITCRQAQDLSNKLSVGRKTSSLMFSIQWELVLKFIESKGAKTKDEILEGDLSSWGNFKDAEFEVFGGSYSMPQKDSSWIKIDSKYEKKNGERVLFTTGISERNSVLNIYDFVGNSWEWILASSIAESNTGHVIKTGISYVSDSNEEGLNIKYMAANHYTSFNENDGFRPALY